MYYSDLSHEVRARRQTAERAASRHRTRRASGFGVRGRVASGLRTAASRVDGHPRHDGPAAS